jgi:hypothetical protein
MYDRVKRIRDSARMSGNFSGSAWKYWSRDRVNARYFVLSPLKGLWSAILYLTKVAGGTGGCSSAGGGGPLGLLMLGEESEWSWRRDESDRERGKRLSEEEMDRARGGTAVSSVLFV